MNAGLLCFLENPAQKYVHPTIRRVGRLDKMSKGGFRAMPYLYARFFTFSTLDPL
jgi:hypothetical protein